MREKGLIRPPTSESNPAVGEKSLVVGDLGLRVPQTGENKIIRKRLLIVASHVVQYSSPVFRELAQDPRIDLMVSYCSMQGAESGLDPGFGVKVSWDMPLLEGYPWTSVRNHAMRPRLGHFFGLFNPGLWKLIRDGHFDAVLVSGYFYASAWISIAAAKWYGIPLLFITDSHSLHSWAAQSKWKLRIKKILVRKILSLGKVLLALSSGGVEHLRTLGYSSDRIVLAPYVVDNAWWSEHAAKINRDAVRASWRIPAHGEVALFCAKLQPWKGPMGLLEAFALANVPHSYLVFAGDGPERSNLEGRATELGLAERVRFLGFLNQSQLPSAYCASDLLVLPSLFEPFGLVVNEAMLCGLPVAVSDRVGARFDLVRPDENGYVFPAGDVEALAAILRQILPDPEQRARMGTAARHRMETWSPREFTDSVVRAVQLTTKHNAAS
jgi:glycosyltransferase involved in cell wall biosynthesis